MPSKPSLVQLIIHIQLDYFFFTLKLISYLERKLIIECKINPPAIVVAISIKYVISSPHFQEKVLYKSCIYLAALEKITTDFF